MHHNVLPDGTVLLLDAFGLTRVTAALRAKTDAKLLWQPHTRLSAGGSHAHVIAANATTWQRRLVAVADLTVAAKLLGGDALLPDGERYVAQGVDVLFDRAHQELGPLRRRDGERRARVTLNEGLFHPATVTLGPSVGDDGRVALAWPGTDDCELTLFDTTPGAERALWRVELRAGSDTVIAPTVTADGVAVVGWRPDAGSATVVDLDADGALRSTVTLPSLGMPAIDGDRVVTQPTEGSVRVTHRRTNESRDHALAEVVAKAPRKKGAPSPTDPNGVGAVIAGRGRTLFAPWHGETVIDLDRGVEIDRKLPAAQHVHRAAFAGWVRTHLRRLVSAGLLAPTRFRAGTSANMTFWCPMVRGAAAERAQVALRELAAFLRAETGLALRGWGTSS